MSEAGVNSKGLLPCPFCGGYPELYDTPDGQSVECSTPECWVSPEVSLSKHVPDDIPSAVEAWNCRVPGSPKLARRAMGKKGKPEISWDRELETFMIAGNPISWGQASEHWHALDADWTAGAFNKMAVATMVGVANGKEKS